MTAQEALDRADALEANQYTPAQKLQWLAELDGKTRLELFPERAAALCGEEDPADASRTLLVPEPFAGELYVAYLLSRIAEANAEIERYNLCAARFNSEYRQFAAWTLRAKRPEPSEGWCLQCRDSRT